MNKKIIKVIAIVLSVISIGSVVVGVVANAAPGVSDVGESEVSAPLAGIPTEEELSSDPIKNQEEQTSETTTTRKIQSSKEPVEDEVNVTAGDNEGRATNTTGNESKSEDIVEGAINIRLTHITTKNERAGDVTLKLKNLNTKKSYSITLKKESMYGCYTDIEPGTYKISVTHSDGYNKLKIASQEVEITSDTKTINVEVTRYQVSNGFFADFFKNNSVLLILILASAAGLVIIKKKNEAKLTRE